MSRDSPTKSDKCLELIWVAWPVQCPEADYPEFSELFYNIADCCSKDKLFPFKALHLVAFDAASGQGLSGFRGSLWPFTTLCSSPQSQPSLNSLPQHTIADCWRFRKGTRNFVASINWIKILNLSLLWTHQTHLILDCSQTHKTLID